MIKRKSKELWEEHVISRLTASNLPLAIIGILGCGIPIMVEPGILGEDILSPRWSLFRAIYILCTIVVAYLLPNLAKTIREKLFGESKKWWEKWIAGGLTLSIYKLPIYSSVALVLGFHWLKVLKLCGIYFGVNLAFGLIYIWINEWCIRKFTENLEANQP